MIGAEGDDLIVRLRNVVAKALWALHLHSLTGWWDAGTDAGESRRYRRRQFRQTGHPAMTTASHSTRTVCVYREQEREPGESGGPAVVPSGLRAPKNVMGAPRSATADERLRDD